MASPPSRHSRFQHPCRGGAVGRPLVALLALLLPASPLLAQAEPAGSTSGVDAPILERLEELQQELRSLQQRLQQIQQEALQDSALVERRLDLQELIAAEMREADSTTTAKEDRLNEVQRELQAAQSERDTARMQALMREGRSLSLELQEIQRQAMQSDSVAGEIQAFQSNLIARMKEIAPEADSLLALQDSLVAVYRELGARAVRDAAQRSQVADSGAAKDSGAANASGGGGGEGGSGGGG